MKINNKKIIKSRIKIICFVLLISVLICISLFYSLIISHKQGYSFWIIGFLGICFFYNLKILLALKYFDYEHSGEVISIKHYYTWQKGIVRPKVELPKYQLESFEIRKNRNVYKLCLYIKGSKGRTIPFYCNSINLTEEQIKNIHQSLQNT